MAMNSETFSGLRALLGRSQRELADILGVSLKTVESYEQGWRRVPANIERILYFLLFKLNEVALEGEEPCWEATACPDSKREHCVAYLAKEGRFCWFFTGRLCAASGAEGAASCHDCPVFARLVGRVRSAAERTGAERTGAKPRRVRAK
ncbi:MAG TPA: helix-turn-helix transcriptional regulator [Rectinemataceae bacterium]|nr:helix-turn-helix transcriptional regulator [Rectinemataceae bacterium]